MRKTHAVPVATPTAGTMKTCRRQKTIAGLDGAPDLSVYCTSKGGVVMLTRALSAELAPLVRVNCVCPGYIDTDMVRAVPEPVLQKIIARIPVGRLGHADEIARAVLFLVADEAGFITGSTVSINGGQHMY